MTSSEGRALTGSGCVSVAVVVVVVVGENGSVESVTNSM